MFGRLIDLVYSGLGFGFVTSLENKSDWKRLSKLINNKSHQIWTIALKLNLIFFQDINKKNFFT